MHNMLSHEHKHLNVGMKVHTYNEILTNTKLIIIIEGT